MRVRWGILGCGNIATHAIAPAIKWSSNGLLVGIASRDLALAQEKARMLDAQRAFGSYQAMLEDPEIDAVYIGLPNGLHETWALRAAEAGKHALCEKSLTFTQESAARICEAFQTRKLRLVEAFMYRHHPQWDRVRALLRDGSIGEVRSFRVGLMGMLDNELDHRWSKELGGGALYDVTCYGVNAARFILQREPVRITATADWHSDGVDSATRARLEFEDSVTAEVEGSLRAPSAQYFVVEGSRGRLEVSKPFVPGWEPTEIKLTRNSVTDVVVIGGANHFLHQVEHFASLVSHPSQALAPAEDGLLNVSVCEAIARAAMTPAGRQ